MNKDKVKAIRADVGEISSTLGPMRCVSCDNSVERDGMACEDCLRLALDMEADADYAQAQYEIAHRDSPPDTRSWSAADDASARGVR